VGELVLQLADLFFQFFLNVFRHLITIRTKAWPMGPEKL
jgi:hypothetical protein